MELELGLKNFGSPEEAFEEEDLFSWKNITRRLLNYHFHGLDDKDEEKEESEESKESEERRGRQAAWR